MSHKIKVAVLGGGISSLSTVFHLTDNPGWQEKYDITLYQLGWRLGGKCASSRNEEVGMRIEEHGLHLWFGFYDHAFHMMKRCFSAYGDPDLTLETAFSGYDRVALQEQVNDTWQTWMNYIPPNSYKIGEKDPDLSSKMPISDYIRHFVGFMYEQYNQHHPIWSDQHRSVLRSEINSLQSSEHYPNLPDHLKDAIVSNADTDNLIDLLFMMAKHIVDDIKNTGFVKLLLGFIDHILKILWEAIKYLVESNSTLRRLWISVEFSVTVIKGFYYDGVIHSGFNVINSVDLRQWLKNNGASSLTVNSALVQAIYGLVFGGKDQYTFEAGTAMEGFLRLTLFYRGHIYYRMNSGMGDIIIGPLYQVLKERGVKFEFFRKVTRIVPSADGTSIGEIHMDVQASLKPEYTTYEPMCVDPQLSLPYWPEHPRYDFLEQGEALKHGGPNHGPVNLESYYADWQPVAQQVLVKDTDFHVVVQGISIGALPHIAKDILERKEREDWRAMVQNIRPVPTIAAQFWFLPTIADMGWAYSQDGLALLGSYQEPYDTWADMSHLIGQELWPAQEHPKNLAYIVGPTPEKFAPLAPFSDHDFPQRQYEMAKQLAKDYLQNLSSNIWPHTFNQQKNHFNWDDLATLQEVEGEQRFDEQYFRANIDPTELYVLSEQGTSQYRLKTDQNGFDNMFLTGDWIDIGFNAGCVECSVTAGMHAAAAVLKRYPIELIVMPQPLSENAIL